MAQGWPPPPLPPHSSSAVCQRCRRRASPACSPAGLVRHFPGGTLLLVPLCQWWVDWRCKGELQCRALPPAASHQCARTYCLPSRRARSVPPPQPPEPQPDWRAVGATPLDLGALRLGDRGPGRPLGRPPRHAGLQLPGHDTHTGRPSTKEMLAGWRGTGNSCPPSVPMDGCPTICPPAPGSRRGSWGCRRLPTLPRSLC